MSTAEKIYVLVLLGIPLAFSLFMFFWSTVPEIVRAMRRRP